jgi:hypothetical protein
MAGRFARDNAGPAMTAPSGTMEITVRVKTIAQLFNTFDPSPFREKDLDENLVEFVAGWVRELPKDATFTIAVCLPAEEAARPEAAGIPEAFTHYFAYRATAAEQELRELFRVGRRFLAIGVTILAVCLGASQAIGAIFPGRALTRILQESLVITGWVANWRPLEIYLYEWIPIRLRIRLYQRIAAAPVTVRAG